jgi:hypothetical protein
MRDLPVANMAPSRTFPLDSDPPSQADTPMSDVNDDSLTRIPVDAPDTAMVVRFINLSHIFHAGYIV